MSEKRFSVFNPHPAQKRIIDAINDPETKYVIVACGRQFGKSKLGRSFAIKWALENKNVNVLWLSPTTGQYEKVFDEIIRGLSEIGCIASSKKSRGTAEIVFKNGSKIIFRSSKQKEGLLGLSIHYCILDEAAYIDSTFVKKVVKPFGLVTGRKMLALSTPKGRNNYFYEWYERGQSDDIKDRKYKSFRFTSYDNPYANLEELEDNRLTLPDAIYRQEILCEWIDDAAVFENVPELCVLPPLEMPLPNDTYYAGLDIGLASDSSVFSIINSQGHLVKYFRWKRLSTPNLLETIRELNKEWGFVKIAIEVNNQGLPIWQELRKSLSNLEDFMTNSRTKSEIINGLVYVFKSKRMLLVNEGADGQMRKELEAFIFTQKEGGYIKYHSPSGINDDCVMSLAIARDCYERNQYCDDDRLFGFFS